MTHSVWIALIFFVSGVSSFAGDLQDETDQEVRNPHIPGAAEFRDLQDTQYIFVDGIFGDFYQQNFKPAERVAIDEWQTDASTVVPQTVVPIPDNAEILFTRVRDLRKSSTKTKAIIIGHSKGAAELLLMALRHPEVISTMGVVGIGIVSSPLAGTHVVRFVDTVCVSHASNPICKYLHRLFPSLQTFRPEIIQPLYSNALAALSPEDFARVEAKVFYVRTEIPNHDYKSRLYIPSWWLRKTYPEEGPNDGAIPTANELMYETGFDRTKPVFGTDLGIMMVDHNSLLNHTQDPIKMAFRKAFFKVLVRRMLLLQNSTFIQP